MGGGITDINRGLSVAPRGLDAGFVRQRMVDRMIRVIRSENSIAAEQQYNGAIRSHTPPRYYLDYFTNDDDRLVYLKLVIIGEYRDAQNKGQWASDPGEDDLAGKMADYEIERIRASAMGDTPQSSRYIPGNDPGSRLLQTTQAMADLNAASQQSELEELLLQMSEDADAARIERHAGKVFTGAHDVDLYQQYIGDPLVGVKDDALKVVAPMVSLMMDFTPILGQIKAIAEAIYGKDLITGRPLEAWERGLGALLAIIPEAKGIFRAGREGLRVVAAIAKDSGKSAAETYKILKGASTMVESEVSAAKSIVNGRPASQAAAEKTLGTLEELAGAKPAGAKSNAYKAISGVIEDGRGISREVADVGKASKAAAPIKLKNFSKKVMAELTNAKVSPEAIAALQRSGLEVNIAAARKMTSPKVVAFLNTFHETKGFERVVQDLAVTKDKEKGAMFFLDYVMDPVNKVNLKTAAFEAPSGITNYLTKTNVSQSRIARYTDLAITDGGVTINFEFKAYSKESIFLKFGSGEKLRQLSKDIAMFGRKNVRWVFDSREATREYIYKVFSKSIQEDAFLAKEFGSGKRLEEALDELIVMYPPVPKAPKLPPVPWNAPAQTVGAATADPKKK